MFIHIIDLQNLEMLENVRYNSAIEQESQSSSSIMTQQSLAELYDVSTSAAAEKIFGSIICILEQNKEISWKKNNKIIHIKTVESRWHRKQADRPMEIFHVLVGSNDFYKT